MMRLVVAIGWCLLALGGGGSVAQAQILPSPPQLQPKSITVVMDDNYPPFIFRDGSGKLQGILRDSWTLWEQRTGITVKLEAMDWGKALQTIQAGQADVIDTIFETEARQKIYEFGPPYSQIDVPIFFHQSIAGIVDADSLKGFTVGVKAGDACIEKLHSHGIDSLQQYPSYSALIDAAAASDVRVFCVDQPPAVYFLNQRGIEKEFRHSVPLYSGQFHRAVRKGHGALLKVVEEGFGRISAAEREAIERKWYGAAIEGAQLSTYARYAAYALLGLGVLALVLALWNQMLRQRVLATTAELRQSKENLAITLNSIGDGVIATDTTGHITGMNPAAEALCGWSLAEAMGQPLAEVFCIFDANTRKTVTNPVQLVMDAGQVVGLANHTVLRGRAGQEYQIADSAAPIRNSAGEIVGVVLVFSDVTEKYRADRELAHGKALFEAIFNHIPDAIVSANVEREVVAINPAFSSIFGFDIGDLAGKKTSFFYASQAEYENQGRTRFNLSATDNALPYEVNYRRKDGTVFPGETLGTGIRTADGTLLGYIGVIRDITERKQHQSQLEHMAHFDALTNLPNRTLLGDRLQQSLSQVGRRRLRLAVVYIDLDGFKAINDQYGHDVGDQLLVAVADRMKQALRGGDTLGRLGGDEFVAVLIDLDDAPASEPMLQRLLDAAAGVVTVGQLGLRVTASLGVTFYPQSEDVDADQLLRQADQAMYQAKLAGKNCYHLFDAEHDSSLRSHHESVERIRLALSQSEFVLFYQPKVNMRTGQVVGVEALIRWQHPGQGLLAPALFLPVIEDHPLAVAIGEWVIDTALTQIENWQTAGLDIPVSVNVGAQQLQQSDFVDRLRVLLAAHPGVNPAGIELEILETSALQDIAKVSQVIDACASIGLMFALDDFGTGYSSLTYLKRLPVSMIKIDQSFVRDMLDDPVDRAILGGVIGLAGAFKHGVIAEGVETLAHGSLLMQLGCNLGQGYGIAYPMPGEQVPEWVKTWQSHPAWG